MNGSTPDRPDRIDDILRLYRLVKITPGLPMPNVSAVRAAFDYRHVVHAEDAREAVDCAAAVLTYVFGVAFTPDSEQQHVNGADGPRFMLEAALPSGLTLVIVSRVSLAEDPAEREDAGELVAA